MRTLLVAPLVALALAFPAIAAGGCVTVSGDFVATAEIPCVASLAAVCTHGTLTGDLEGRYEFVMDSQSVLSDPARPLLLTFTGASEVILADGVMFAQDHGEMEVNPVGPWAFETTVNIHSGNGAYAGAVGQLVATGALDTQAGVTQGVYSGIICV